MTAAAPALLQVSVERRGAVAIVGFNNPPHGFIASKGAAQLRDAVAAALDEPAVRAIVLTGDQDGVFIRHADVGQIARAGDALAAGSIGPESFATGPFMELGALLDTATKPVIAAIGGVCMGGGFELALACTMRVAGQGVRAIGLPEIRIGIFPGAGGILRLTEVIGLHRARLFVLRGEVVPADAALALGLVDEVAPCALDRAVEIAEELAARRPAAVAGILSLARERAPLPELGVAFGELLRDDAGAQERLHAFVAGGERLDEVP